MIEVRNLIVELDDFTLGPLSLEIGEGEFFIILGPTGAGKTALLETIVGVYRPSSGRILIEGQDLTFLPPERRGIGIVYQDYSLFPHLTVRRNIGFGLRLKGIPKGERERRVQELVELLGIGHLLDRYPPTLSGGEGKGSPWPGPWPPGRSSCSSMNLFPPSIPRSGRGSPGSSRG